MLLSGKDVAGVGLSKFSKTVQCPWCEGKTVLDLQPFNVTGDVSLHCHRCGKFSLHKTADKWFDAHTERFNQLKDVWRKIPSDAFVTCRQSARGTPFIYTIFLGG